MITRADVVEFLETVHGHPPFPWQLKLAEAALAGQWPDAVDAPTGLGKTWSIDVAVLAIADAGLRGDRNTFRRIFFVVDRRTVVDEAYDHTQRLAHALAAAPDGSVVGRVARGLRALRGRSGLQELPLDVTRMRGGATWSSRWAERPDQPLVVLSTVDQVGSRLLFRGYGVSNGMRPVDAALVGCHSLLLLDEAHLSRPFADMLGLVHSIQQTRLDVAGLKVVSLSATQTEAGALLPFDVTAHRGDDTARGRLESDKHLAVLDATVSGRPKVISAAVQYLLDEGARRILVTCNTVAGARTVHRLLTEQRVEAGLLTGRSRPSDRDLVCRTWLSAFSRPRNERPEPRVLVATQTVEVGVNIDVDVLVTEECGLDALVQRLGRVNRFGAATGTAVVVAVGSDDPVYGPAAPATTRWLTSVGAPVLPRARNVTAERSSWLDVSPLALRVATLQLLQGSEVGIDDLNRPRTSSPMTDPGLLPGWAQTSPLPFADVPVEPYLHGLSASDTTVVVAWRADLGSADSLGLPLDPAETIELPLRALRGWLAGSGADTTSDLEGASPESEENPSSSVLRLLDGTRGEWTTAMALRPGDRVVLKASQGGLDRWGWDAEGSLPVLDIADVVSRRGTFLVRVDERTLRPLVQGGQLTSSPTEAADAAWAPVSSAVARLRRVIEVDEDHHDALAALADALIEVSGPATDERLVPLLPVLAGGKVDQGRRTEGEVSRLVVELVPGSSPHDPNLTNADDERPGSTALLGRKVELRTHAEAVGQLAAEFASALGMSDALTRTLNLAGRWHDLGKLDSRFQALLWGGVRPYRGATVLAKSGVRPRSDAGRRAARAARYPAGMRHEALSGRLTAVRLATDPPGGVDPDLLVHLVESHHGRARPLLATVDDPSPEDVSWQDDGRLVTVSSAVPEEPELVHRFNDLNQRYGPWGLALLESIVRLADMTCSSEGS